MNSGSAIIFECTWESPSNIALIKYWGKRPIQLPMNPSISMTLSVCASTTTLKAYSGAEKGKAKVYSGGKELPAFLPKVQNLIDQAIASNPVLGEYCYHIETKNSFPHGAGIASSASGMSALALCLVSFQEQLSGNTMSPRDFERKASVLSRLGSGSACRSVLSKWGLWGKTEAESSSNDEYAVRPTWNIHSCFEDMRDCILIVDEGEKSVSSSAGHKLLETHPYADARFKRANANLIDLKKAMEEGDFDAFTRIVELEAMDLHALMMSGTPSYMLMKPGTLQLIEEVKKKREQSGLNIVYTLDAGPNLHLLYPGGQAEKVEEWINKELIAYLASGMYFCDRIGSGPNKLSE